MAVNTKEGKRRGIIKNRKQVYNSKTGRYIKINTETGKFVSNSEKPYKAIRKVQK